jgi:CheY-like chemotaxis protein
MRNRACGEWATSIGEAGQGDFDLIIMDSQMPVMNGLEATKRIRSRSDWKNRIPILSLAADATEGGKGKAIAAGADVCMTKPFKVDCLLAVAKILVQCGRMLRRNWGASVYGAGLERSL